MFGRPPCNPEQRTETRRSDTTGVLPYITMGQRRLPHLRPTLVIDIDVEYEGPVDDKDGDEYANFSLALFRQSQ